MVLLSEVIILTSINQKNHNKQTLSIMSSEFKNLKTKYNYLNSTKEGVF